MSYFFAGLIGASVAGLWGVFWGLLTFAILAWLTWGNPLRSDPSPLREREG